MKSTKKYLKALTMFIVMTAFIVSFAIAIFIGIVGITGLFASEYFAIALLFILIAIIFGFVTSVLNDLIKWLDKKFRPY